jgi:hypothetical protein
LPRRIFQTLALLVMVLTGSVPGVQLAWAARAHSCCPEKCLCMPPGQVPTRTNNTPCGPRDAGTVLMVAAPRRAGLVQVRVAARTRVPEPSPVPAEVLALNAARLRGAGPSALPRPGPMPPDLSPPSQEILSTFRI